jgi:2-C-methyl-D-erythritol 4-phosphate cytidylyltransferase
MIKFSCIILAAGDGIRFGKQKQFVKWHNKQLWKHVADKCKKVSDDIIIVGIDIKGGKTRQESVFNGLTYVKYPIVVILEAARPNVTIKQIKKIALTITKSCPSVSYFMPSIDTIYDCNIGYHLKRNMSFRLQVPQAFDTRILKYCHDEIIDGNFTSDTEIVQKVLGIKPKLIYGGYNLMKITFKRDLKILDVIMNEY